MAHWVDVGASIDFEEASIRVVNVEGIEIGIARVNADFYAMRNVCPHTGAPVCLGRLGPLFTADGSPWQLESQTDRVVVSCPWHFWEFDVVTGQAIIHRRMHLRKYPVVQEGTRILVDIGRRPEATAPAAESPASTIGSTPV